VVAQQSIAFVVTVSATILVVSCPCALGIATPAALMMGLERVQKKACYSKVANI
jgi:cation transport ATPase